MHKKKGGNGGEPPKRFPRPLIECRSKKKITELFDTTLSFAREKREYGETLSDRQGSILQEYDSFSKHERAFFFSLLYDQFAGTYDQHMGLDTGHYGALREVFVFSAQYFKSPVLDITAGTGELLSFALDLADAGDSIRSHDMTRAQQIASGLLPDIGTGSVVANEISPRMLEIAKSKLEKHDVAFTSYNALGLPANWLFRTVLCSQTMHLLAEPDKKGLVQSIHDVLLPGGHAIVLEEDPFIVSPTASIDGVGLFISAVACPMKTDALLGMFEVNGFTYTEHRAAHQIDSDHLMRLHVFRKSS